MTTAPTSHRSRAGRPRTTGRFETVAELEARVVGLDRCDGPRVSMMTIAQVVGVSEATVAKIIGRCTGTSLETLRRRAGEAIARTEASRAGSPPVERAVCRRLDTGRYDVFGADADGRVLTGRLGIVIGAPRRWSGESAGTSVGVHRRVADAGAAVIRAHRAAAARQGLARPDEPTSPTELHTR